MKSIGYFLIGLLSFSTIVMAGGRRPDSQMGPSLLITKKELLKTATLETTIRTVYNEEVDLSDGVGALGYFVEDRGDAVRLIVSLDETIEFKTDLISSQSMIQKQVFGGNIIINKNDPLFHELQDYLVHHKPMILTPVISLFKTTIGIFELNQLLYCDLGLQYFATLQLNGNSFFHEYNDRLNYDITLAENLPPSNCQ